MSNPFAQPDLPTIRRVVSLDLGKQQDPTALSLLEWEIPPLKPVTRTRTFDFFSYDPPYPLPRPAIPDPPTYYVRTLKRWPLGTPYLAIGRKLVQFLEQPELWGCLLVLDKSGVGDAVCEIFTDLLTKASTKAAARVGVTITAGTQVHCEGEGNWRVAKVQLCSIVKALLGTGRLVVLPDVPERKVLVDELQNFQIRVTESKNEVFEARQGKHDDVVLSVALGCWAAETVRWGRVGPPPPRRVVT